MSTRPDIDTKTMDTMSTGLQIPPAPDDSYGTISMEPHEDLEAGSFVTLTFTYVVGEGGMAVGGNLKIGTPCTGWGEPLPPFSRYWYEKQPASFKRRNTEAELITDGDATVEVFAQEKMLRYAPPGGHWRWWICVAVENAPLKKGDVIKVTYGDTSWGEDGVQVQKFRERDAYFMAIVDVDGSGQYVEIPKSPFRFNVIAGPPQRVHITVPSLIKRGLPFNIKLALTDRYWNPAYGPAIGELRFHSLGHTVNKPQTVALSEFQDHHYVLSGARFDEIGYQRIEVLDSSGSLKGTSNPTLVGDDEVAENIYWGDLHSQSQFHGPGAWSVGTPEELYDYARQVSHLDFAAITDDVAPLSEGWSRIQEAAVEHYEPGAFVPFKAFEWCSKKYGHRNVIFADDEMEPPYPESIFTGSIEDFYGFFRERDILIIPHHTFLWTKWDYHDPDLEPLVEIYSCWGASERHGSELWDKSEIPGGGVQAALAHGYQLGFVGSTDTCAGMPGRSVPNGERLNFHNHKGGLTAVYAPELTREATFKALKQRRCYATTGARIILDFRINGHPMGSKLEWKTDGRPQLAVRAVGSDAIRKIEVVRNNQDIYVHEASNHVVELEYEDRDDLWEIALRGVTGALLPVYYYVRVTQADGEVAWSSPIWVSLPAELAS